MVNTTGYTLYQTEPMWKFALELLSLWTIIFLPIGDSRHSAGKTQVSDESLDGSDSNLSPQLALSAIKPVIADEESA